MIKDPLLTKPPAVQTDLHRKQDTPVNHSGTGETQVTTLQGLSHTHTHMHKQLQLFTKINNSVCKCVCVCVRGWVGVVGAALPLAEPGLNSDFMI